MLSRPCSYDSSTTSRSTRKPWLQLATGTGIAPFRSFLWKMLFKKCDDYKFNGLAWLLLGVLTSSSLLYPEVRTSIIFMSATSSFFGRRLITLQDKTSTSVWEVLLELIQAFNTTDRRRPADIQYLRLG